MKERSFRRNLDTEKTISEWFDEFYMMQNGISLEEGFAPLLMSQIAVESAGGERRRCL